MGELIRKILSSEPARRNLVEIRSWNERFDPSRAKQEGPRLRTEIEKLASFRRLGRRVKNSDGGPEEIRELVIAPYIVRYVLTREYVIVVRLWHGSKGVVRGLPI